MFEFLKKDKPTLDELLRNIKPENRNKKIDISECEKAAETAKISDIFNGIGSSNAINITATCREQSRLFLEAARFARGSRNRRANHLYRKAIQKKAYEFSRTLNNYPAFWGVPGKHIQINDLTSIAREFGNEAKAVELAAHYGNSEIAGRLALELGMTKEAEKLFERALDEYKIRTYGEGWAVKRLTPIHPKSVIMHYKRTGQYDQAIKLARKICSQEQTEPNSQLATKLA